MTGLEFEMARMVFDRCFASVVLALPSLVAVLKCLLLSPTCCRARPLLFSLVSFHLLCIFRFLCISSAFSFFSGMYEFEKVYKVEDPWEFL